MTNSSRAEGTRVRWSSTADVPLQDQLPSALAVLFYGASFYIFNLSLRGIEISVAYAVWSAVVMAALAGIGMTVLGESVTTAKVAGIAAIIVGTMLLSKDLAS